MALEFDPDWEYFVGDEEVSEILKEAEQLEGFARAFGEYPENKRDYRFRVGKGNPDRLQTRLAPEKYRVSRPLQKTRRLVTCRGCGWSFYRQNARVHYCHRSCYWRYRPQPPKPAITCATCQGQFVPKRQEMRYCSRKCRPHFSYLTEKPCAGCGVVFRPKKSITKYCGNRCRHLAKSQVMIGRKLTPESLKKRQATRRSKCQS